MKIACKIFLLLFFVIVSQVVFGQCAVTLAASTTNSTCVGCNNGTASASVSGGIAPYTYVWTNNITPGTATFAASKDNSIYEQTTGNSNGAGQNFVAGETNAGFKNRALIAFDIAGNIPAGATITSTNLKINMLFTSGASGPQTQSIHKLLQNWGEGTSVATQAGQGVPATTNDATWLNTFFPATDWTTAGGTFNATASAATIVDQQAIYTWSSATMIADIQSWLNTPASNFGWLLKGDESGNRQAKRYGSRENVVPGNAPLLTVNYGPGVIGNTSLVSNLAPGTYTVTVIDANGCTATAIASITTTIITIPTTTIPDITSYRGAFAPGEPQWTDNWTNWDPQNTAYGATTVNVTGSITASTTWTSNNVYKISGIVYVNSGVTLTIQPGTVIRGDDAVANSSLFVARGGKINAIGTACNPIVFTSNKATGARAKGDWGGVVLLGNAFNNAGTNVQIEGTSAGEPRNFHGGSNNADNSGILKYVRIEFGGFVFAPNNEINGLTLGSVGSGTTIDYVQTSFINDDAFEWFGGAVNCKHLVAYRCLDDDFDTDNGFSGIVQYGLGIKDPNISDDPLVSTSEGFESDNNAGGTTATPKTSAKFYNITQIGAFRCNNNTGIASQPPAAQPNFFTSGFRRGLRLRRNTELKIFNSIFMNNWRGLVVDAVTLATAGQAFQNNLIAGDFATTWVAPYAGVSLYGEDAPTTAFLTTAAFNNQQISTGGCSLLTNVWGGTSITFPSNPDFRPNAASASFTTLTTGATGSPDLTAVVEIDNTLFTANQALDFLVDPFEQSSGATSGIITITIPKPSGWNITVPGLTLTNVNQSGVSGTSNVSGGTPNDNGNWNFRDDGTNVIATSKPGQTIELGGFRQVGFTSTRKATTSTGTNQSLGVTISGGGDITPGNNSAVTSFSAN